MKLQIRDEAYYRPTKAILEHIQKVVDSYDMPITSRQIFYRLVALGIVKNTLNGYRKVCGICSKGRYTGHLDWDKIVDDTRGTYKTQDWDDMEEAVEHTIDNFRLDRWAENADYIEIFVEKRGMINTLYPTTNKLDVHITACGGFNSTSNVWKTVKRLMNKQDQGKDITILYFGDFDPSGDCMDKVIRDRLQEFDLNIELKRILLNLEHIQEYDLPVSYEVLTSKADGIVYDKLSADPRAKRFIDKHGKLMQVEIDALDPAVLVEYVENSILEYLNESAYNRALEQEEAARKIWRKLI